MRSPRLLALLMLFFCSGACSLTYQVLWLRQLSLVFGVTVYAASTVLAAFMTGLAIGSLLTGRVLARISRPLVAFGIAEIGIGLSALATPVLLDSAAAIYAALYRETPGSIAWLTLVRLICSFAVLLVPTALMGLTLPLLSASSLVRTATFGSRLGALYAVNTSGAVAGTLTTGYYLIGWLGMRHTFMLAAAINVGLGLLAIALSTAVDESQAETESSAIAGASRIEPTAWRSGAHRAVLGAVAISGFASLALEIVWFRTLVQFLNTTTYAFTTMLATVLVGIAIGGACATRVLARRRDWLKWLTIVTMGTGATVLGSMIFLGWSYQAGWRTSSPIQACVAAILPAAVMMGLAFPIALRLSTMSHSRGADDSAATGQTVGRVYALNVIGAIAGSLAGGFLVVPWFGVRNGLIVLSALYLVAGAILCGSHPVRRHVVRPAAICALLFVVAIFRVPDPFETTGERRHGNGFRGLWRHEGAQAAVNVGVDRTGRVMFLDGLHQAGDDPGMVRLHRTIGHLPMALHPAPTHALVIGLGGGTTAGAVSQHAGVQVDIVEVSDSVRLAAAWFSHVNYDVLRQPGVRLHLDDGRTFLQFTSRKFDVITADIIQPIWAGAGNLYSREYFTLARQALADGGLMLQWLGHRPAQQYKLIMRTFVDVFPEATIWLDAGLMVGSVQPLRLSRPAFERKLADPKTAAALAAVGLDSFEVLRSWYTAGPADMRRFVGEGPVLTDNRPLVEYHRSLPQNDELIDVSTLRGNVADIANGN